ncbi:MAG TPA: tetratricopeptide repeat protein [Myxococcaceae bacterium]|nr:tetratricopeptide repeat protein [Myxococcaceae bacterium]
MGSEREEQFRKLAADHPSSPMVHFSLGKLLLDERRYAEAAESLGRAVSLQPDYAAALVALGDALAGAGRRDEARQVLQGARETALAQNHPSLAEEIDQRLGEL